MMTAAAMAARIISPGRSGAPDRLTVVIYAVAAFLAVLALLAWQVRAAPIRQARQLVVVRRVYDTRIVETIVGRPGIGSSTTQSISSSGSSPPLGAAPATRTSH